MLRPAQAPPAARRPAQAGPCRPPHPHLLPSRPPAAPRRQRPRAPPRASADDVTGAPGRGAAEQGARLRSAVPSSRFRPRGSAVPAELLRASAVVLVACSRCRAECAGRLRVLDAGRSAAAEASAHPQPRALTRIHQCPAALFLSASGRSPSTAPAASPFPCITILENKCSSHLPCCNMRSFSHVLSRKRGRPALHCNPGESREQRVRAPLISLCFGPGSGQK